MAVDEALVVEDFTINKHAAAIRIANRMSLAERRTWNVLLFRCYPRLLSQETHALPIRDLAFDVGCTPNNLNWLMNSFRALNRLEVEWNVIQAGQRRWGVTTALAHAEIVDGRICEWSYPAPLRRALYQPEIYGRLNLHVQKNFRRAHALALWEFFHLHLGGDRSQATCRLTVAEYCDLLSVSEHYREEFRLLSYYAIKPVLAEISTKSDLAAKVTYVRDGRGAVSMLEFDISRRDHDCLETQDPLTVRLIGDFGISPEDAATFRLKYRHSEVWLGELLDDIQRRYAAGRIPRSRVPAYTRATLGRAGATAPQVGGIPASTTSASTAAGAERTEPTPTRPPPDADYERGSHRFAKMPESERASALAAWISTPGAQVCREMYQKHGLRSPIARAAFLQWLGQSSETTEILEI